MDTDPDPTSTPPAVLAEIVTVGHYFDPPNRWSPDKPALTGWHTTGGDFAAMDMATGSIGGWSTRTLREMAATFGTAVIVGGDRG